MAKRMQLTVTRMQIMIGLAMLENIKVPGALILGKLQKFGKDFLAKYPENVFQLTLEAKDEEKETANGEATQAK